MYQTATHVHHANHAQPAQAYHPQPPPPNHQAQPNGHSHVPNGHPAHGPPQATPRARPGQPPTQVFDPVHVYGVPSVTVQQNQLIVGDANTTSARHYTPIKVVGDGSFGTVWLVDWHGTLPPDTPLSAMQRNAGTRPEFAGKRLVAVKRMKKTWNGGWDECRKLKELESLRIIPYHPNVIPLYDFFLLPESKELYFVFESMEGNLYQLIKSRRNRFFASGLVCSIFTQTIKGLHHIHASGYFHRDMKPENLLVTTTGLHDYTSLSPVAAPGTVDRDVVVIVKIADFGLAREITSQPPYTEYVSTRWYRAPEVLLRSRSYSAPVDMWAFGAIMAELVDLRPLFPGSDEMDQVMKICGVLGDPSDAYGVDKRGKPNGGGKWDKGIKLAKRVGCSFPKYPPRNMFAHFHESVPVQLVECIVDLLRYDPDVRLTSKQCLAHPYVRDMSRLNNPPLLRPVSSPAAPAGRPPLPPVPHPSLPPGVAGGVPAVPGIAARTVPPSHTHTAVSHQNPRRPAFDPQAHPPLIPPIPEVASSHRAAFYASSSSSGTAGDTRNPPYGSSAYASSSSTYDFNGQQRIPNGGWPQAPSQSSIPSDGDPMDMASPTLPHTSPMVQDTDPMQDVVNPAPGPSKLGKLGSLSLGRMWGRGKPGNGDKSAMPSLPPVDEMDVPGPALGASLKRAGSNGHEAAPLNAKEAKKEAERRQKEAEIQRRAMVEQRARDQARAVLAKRSAIIEAGIHDGQAMFHAIEANRADPNPTGNHTIYPSAERKPEGGVHRQRQTHPSPVAGKPYATAGRYVSPGPAGDASAVAQDVRAWREAQAASGAQQDGRTPKARRRDWDDDHSMSSSDVHSLSRVSAISFATVDSDPGPGHRAHRGLFGLGRMTSTSSLRTSFDSVPPSVRSSARSDAGTSGTSSPPPMHMLSLSSPTMRPWHSPTHAPGSDGRPAYIALPPPRMHHLHPNDYTSQAAFVGPPSPGLVVPKSAINPMFKVPLPEESEDMESPLMTALPPFSEIEAIAESGEGRPLSPMRFTKSINMDDDVDL